LSRLASISDEARATSACMLMAAIARMMWGLCI
jgi:hypothetical protein